MFSSVILIASLITSAAAHGYVSKVTINGKSFSGNAPGANTKDSIIRQVSTNAPVKGTDNKALICGSNAKKAALVADAMPGDEITFDWPAGGGQSWPHNTGPMLTYLASCGDQSCDEFNAANARWFKIQQVGKKSNGNWAQADLMTGKAAKITLPATLAPGNYLIRHEIIALHLASSSGGAEFYPSCSQIRVGGNQTGKPKDSELVSFPGAYSTNDAGIRVNAYDGSDYKFPGPKIASFVSGASSSGSGNNAEDEAASSSAKSTSNASKSTSSAIVKATAAASESSNSNSSGSNSSKNSSPCSKNKKRGTNRVKREEHKPRHLSRIMRDIVARDGFSSTH